MFDITFMTLGTVGFVLLNQAQKRTVPSSYYEVLDLAFGIDSELNAVKIFFRFGFPFGIGVVLGFFILLDPAYSPAKAAYAAGAVGFLGCTILVAPAFLTADMRPEYAPRLSANIVTAYLSFILANAMLASLGTSVALGLIDAAAAFPGTEAGGFLRNVGTAWLTGHLPYALLDAVALGLVLTLWRYLVLRMVKRWK